MAKHKALNLFYQETPDTDRWIPFDRFPRRAIRRIVRGSPRPGGQTRVYLNLRAGLDRLGVAYRVNDFRHARRNPGELACIVGRPHVLDLIHWNNPIMFGAAVFSHPTDDPTLIERLDIRRVLVPGEWMRLMCEPYWAGRVAAWPVGIDTETWRPSSEAHKDIDVLFYDKVRWERDRFRQELIDPVLSVLQRHGANIATLRYGHYGEQDFHSLLRRSRAMIFLCEHETQGIAYQQALASGVPILAWDRGGYWQDPAYFPHRVKFGPVSCVPYWDERCGMKFERAAEFEACFMEFSEGVREGRYSPREFILENLTLEKCANDYMSFARQLES